MKDLDLLIKPFLDEIVLINAKYEFGRIKDRSEEDKIRSNQLWESIKTIEDDYDIKNPLPPCNACGRKCLASFDGNCLNPKCDKFIPPGE